ncbi:Rossmann-like domain-containing protein [Aestuariimicrobium sp. Y1814]|uniref:Rossmann-like domain-containing protein n=1 Tax=Aestuariimicrobium sp. Y1814 TaxID=3418742 RepID=UPI003DA71231
MAHHHEESNNPWALYEALVDGIPEGIEVVDAVVNRWAAVRSEQGAVGVAMTYEGGPRADLDAWRIRGRTLREVAAHATSWDLRLASLGVAAMNAWYSSPEVVRQLPGVEFGEHTKFFTSRGPELGRVPTAIVGHFTNTEGLGGDITVLERLPRGDDLPDTAAEYVLPTSRLVAITGSTLVNKTLPRLLELSRHAEVALVGPSTVPALGVYPQCVRAIHGSVVVDPDEYLRLAALGVREHGSAAVQVFSLRR